MTDFSANVRFSPCMHRRLIVETSGGWHFSGGEVWDDVKERLRCLDCLEYVTEEEVRECWNGGAPDASETSQEEPLDPF